MTEAQQSGHHAGPVRRVRRRRQRTLKSRLKRAVKKTGLGRHVYIVSAGVVAIALAYFLCDLFYNVFPMKTGK